MKIILHWVLISLSVWIASLVISGITLSPIWVALVVGGCIDLFNVFIRPIIKVLTLPINVLTLGLFSFIINAILFWYLAYFIKGFTVKTFGVAFVGSLFISVLNWALTRVFRFD